MPYIGRDTDKISNVEVLDNITFDGSSSYTLQKGGSNFTPSSANTLLVSIDGVVQAGNFTVSGSTIDFGTAVAGTSTCDFILHYGTGLITTPADGTVTSAKIASSAVDLTSKVTGTLPVANGGTNLTSGFKNGITEADQWRLTADFTGNADPITSNLERNDTTGSGYFGTGMTESSGIFTFPSTGYWLILADFSCQNTSSNAAYNFFLKITTDNSTYNKGADAYVNPNNNGSNTIGRSIQFLFDVTNTTTHKIQFGTTSSDPTNSVTKGNTTYNATSFSFIRLGNT